MKVVVIHSLVHELVNILRTSKCTWVPIITRVIEAPVVECGGCFSNTWVYHLLHITCGYGNLDAVSILTCETRGGSWRLKMMECGRCGWRRKVEEDEGGWSRKQHSTWPCPADIPPQFITPPSGCCPLHSLTHDAVSLPHSWCCIPPSSLFFTPWCCLLPSLFFLPI